MASQSGQTNLMIGTSDGCVKCHTKVAKTYKVSPVNFEAIGGVSTRTQLRRKVVCAACDLRAKQSRKVHDFMLSDLFRF
jgi:hypothetical protein